MLAAVPATKTGTLTDKDARWLIRDVQAGYASPVTDGQRIYVVDNGGILFAHDAKTGSARVGAEPRHDSEVVAGAGRRQALRRNREREVLHHPAARRSARRSSTRTGSAASRVPNRSSRRPPSRAVAIYVVVDERDLRDRSEDARPRARRRGPVTAAAKPAASALPAGVARDAPRDANRADPQAGRIDRADREGVRRQRRGHRIAWPGDLDGGESEGHDRRRQVHGRPRRRSAGGHGQGHGRDDRRRGARSASSPICPGASTSRTAARCRRRNGPTPPASSPCATSTAARCSSSSRRTTSRSPSAAGRSSARPN